MKKLSVFVLLAAVVSVVLAQAAFAQSNSQTYQATLDQLNGSGASGNATVTVNGDQVTVNIETSGLAPNQPHAQHIHIGGQNVCPPASADKNGDGITTVVEGMPFYGGVKVALTTKGDTSMNSGFAVPRMPVADANGNVSYSRTFTLPQGVSPSDIANGVIVQHGIDLNNNGKYDGVKSTAMPALPQEATVPADCGKLVAVSMPNTGGPSSTTLALLGGAALISLGAAAGFVARRRTV